MPTIAEALTNSAAALDRATTEVLGLRSGMANDIANGLAQIRGLIQTVTPTALFWYVDPANGSDTNGDGKSLLTAFKSLDKLFGYLTPNTGHLVYLFGDDQINYLQRTYASIRIYGCTSSGVSGNGYQYPLTPRTITFKPEALNSPQPFGGPRNCGGIVLSADLAFYSCNLVLPDIQDGVQPGVFMFDGPVSLSVQGGSILGVTASNPNQLLRSLGSWQRSFFLSGTVAAAAQGRIFYGVAPGANPKTSGDWNTNLTVN